MSNIFTATMRNNNTMRMVTPIITRKQRLNHQYQQTPSISNNNNNHYQKYH